MGGNMKKKKIKALVVSVVCAILLIAAVTAISILGLNKGPFSGCVTDDATGKPIANVCVTDGMNVVKTNDNGEFKLNGWRKSHFVTVTVPSGYQTDDYYIPVNKNTKSYDFTLNKSDVTSQTEHSFVQISDTEIGASGTGEWLDNVKKIVKQNNPAFLIHTGDLCYEDGIKKHIEDMNTETMGCTVRYVIGNHDYVKGKYGEELYESIYGPVWYSFDVGNIHYVVTSFQTGSDFKSCYNKNDRWKWLKNDLDNVDDNKKVIMFNHTKSPSDDFVLSFGKDELDLKKHNLIAWIYGHYHYNYVNDTDGVLNISTARPDCGGIDSSVAGVRLVNIGADDSVSTNMIYYSLVSTQPQNTVWNSKLQGNLLYCDTVYDDGNIYTATVDDDFPRNCGVYQLDAENGNIKWYCQTENSVKNNLCITPNGISAMDAEGNVYCIDKQNGNILWKTKVGLGINVGTSSAITVNDGVLFAGNSSQVTAVDTANGKVIWTKVRNKGENSPAEFIVANDKLIVNSHWDALVALDIKTGDELWSNDDEDIRFRSSTPTLLDKSTLIVADDNAIMLVNLDDGSITDKTTFEDYSFSSSGQPAVLDGIAYIPTSNKGLVAFDIKSKSIVWNFETQENILFSAPYMGKGSKTVESSPITEDNKIIFGANDGYIYCVDAKSGKVIEKFNAGSAVFGKVFVKDNKLYAGSFDGDVVCYTLLSQR